MTTLAERTAQWEKAKEWYAVNSTGFVTINGETVHKCRLFGVNVYTLCGSDGGDTTGKRSVQFVDGPCTCQRCNKK